MLAIVIPFYKLTFFNEVLTSLARQTNGNFRVYVGNDASPEDPEKLLNQFSSELSITYKKFDRNLGSISLTKQWNRCLNLVQDEDWIMLLGDDDYISENYIEEFYKQIEEVEKLNIKVVRFASRVIVETNDEKEVSKTFFHPQIEDATDSFCRKFLGSSRGSLSEFIFAKNAYLKHKFRNFPLGWGSDNYAWLDFSEFGKIFTINTAVAFIRISSINISRPGYKEEVKHKAKCFYLTTLIRNDLRKFKRFQRVPLLLYYEKEIYRSREFSFSFWFNMNFYFIREKDLIQVLRFNKRFLIFLKTIRFKQPLFKLNKND